MRTTRVYQAATPAARIMDFIANKASRQFDQHLVRRFIHLMGIYPPATLVRLTDGSVGIVVDGGGAAAVTVRVLFDASGTRLESPRLRQLAQAGDGEPGAPALAVDAPLDPSMYDIEPGDYL
jgi:hypothetical protein